MNAIRKLEIGLGISLLVLGCAGRAYGQQSLLNVTPAQLTFNSTNGVVTGGAQNLVVVSSSGSAVNFTATASSSTNWLSVAPPSGATPLVVAVTASPGTLATGTYVGFVTITAASGTPQTIPVTFNVNGTTNSQIIPSQNTLLFNFPIGSATAQTQQITLGASGGNFAFTTTPFTSGGGNWLVVNPATGNSSSTIGVTVNPAGLTPGFYYGAVSIATPGSTGVVIPVQVNIAVASAINVYPQYLNFGYQLGQPGPATQTVFLSTTQGGPIPFTVMTETAACVANWFTVAPTSGSAPGALTVTINTAALQTGYCNGNIYITAPGAVNQNITIPISLLVSTTPQIQGPTVGPIINYQTGTATPAPLAIPITSTGAALNYAVSFSASSGGPLFLTATPTSGSTPGTLMLGVDPAALAKLTPNTYAENVTIGAGATQQSFTVILNVSGSPFLVTSQQSVSFNYQVGQATPTAQTLNLTSSGSPVAFNIYTSTSSCPGFLQVSPTSGTTSLTAGTNTPITVTAVTQGLTTAQTCSGVIYVVTPGSTVPPVEIPVTVNVSTGAAFSFSPAVLNLTGAVGTSTAATATINLTSTDGTSAFNYTATAVPVGTGASWLTVTPATGSVPATITVSANPNNIDAGIYTGSINLTSTNSSVPPQSIPVTFTVK